MKNLLFKEIVRFVRILVTQPVVLATNAYNWQLKTICTREMRLSNFLHAYVYAAMQVFISIYSKPRMKYITEHISIT